MSLLQQDALKNLREARKQLLAIPKQSLTYSVLMDWLNRSRTPILQGGNITGNEPGAWNPMPRMIDAHGNTADLNILDAVRDELIQHLDRLIAKVEGTQTVRPVLDDLILKVTDTKLSTLLSEFNTAKDNQPNLAAVGFRTILCLLIVELAKKRQPQGTLAAVDDFRLDRIVQKALDDKLFDDGERRLVERFRDSPKVMFDIVAHKPGDKSLVDKPVLSNSVDILLNQLLKALVAP